MRNYRTVDVTKTVANILEKKGYGDDSNNERDITKAGMWDVLNALSSKDNSKFTKDQARAELKRRGV